MSDDQTQTQAPSGKGRPTPSRKAREAENRRPIVVADRKEARRIAKEKDLEQRAKANAGYAAGDERYLPQRDRGPQKRWVRDYVDARLNIGEFVIPVMFLVIILMYLPIAAVQEYVTYALFGFFALIVLDTALLAQRIQKRVNARWGDRAERVRWYASTRALQLRLMRMPKPQVKRFQFPDEV